MKNTYRPVTLIILLLGVSCSEESFYYKKNLSVLPAETSVTPTNEQIPESTSEVVENDSTEEDQQPEDKTTPNVSQDDSAPDQKSNPEKPTELTESPEEGGTTVPEKVDPTAPIDPIKYEDQVTEVKDKCSNGTLVQHEPVVLKFNEAKEKCDWNNPEKHHVGLIDFRITARKEESKSFTLPEGATLCEINLASERSKFTYDDHIFLTLNGFVLFASFPPLVSDFKTMDNSDLPVYDWDRILRKRFNNKNLHRFCLGADLGSHCNVPQTQETGEIDISIVSEKIMEIMALNPTSTTHNITFVTTGDNNPGPDCQHSDFELNLDIKYVVE